MCGIAGIWNFDGKPIDEQTIIRFTDSLRHRGPDGRGIWHNPERNLAFGHRRLAILDLSHEADQPLHYADDRYHIVFNGEIFNFIEIREELKSKGYSFKTEGDTEVVMAAYHEWGENMQFRFNGMWALALYDRQKNECFISRDRFGIKPFLYLLTESTFAFASELKAFRSLDSFTPEINKAVGHQFLLTGFGVEGGSTETLISGVKKLKAGHCGILKNGTIQLKKWWNTADHLVSIPQTFEEQAEQFRALFYDSVKLRMRSDVSVGSCLSGGFDSSAVVSALAEIGKSHPDVRMAHDWQQTFIATFPGKSNDERPQAEEVVQYAGVAGHFFEVKEEESLAILDQVLMDFDDVYVGIPVAPWMIYRELRNAGVVVSLDGHGTDELIGGYLHAPGAFISNAPPLIGDWKQNRELFKAMHQYVGSDGGWKGDLALAMQYHPDLEGIRKAFSKFKGWKDSLMSPDSAKYLTARSAEDGSAFYADEVPEFMDETNRNLYRMFHYDVLPTILRNFDRMSMAHGIEVRMPFMDWRLVTYAFSLPGSAKIKDGYTKRVAREAMKGRMPESIRASRVKIGFNAPMPEWFNGPLKPWIHNLLDSAGENELINVKAMKLAIEKENGWNWSNTGNTWKFLHYLWFEKNFLKQ